MKQSVIFLLPSLCSYINYSPSFVCRMSAAMRLWVCQLQRLTLIGPSFLPSLKYPRRSLISLQILRSGVSLIEFGFFMLSERSQTSMVLKMWAGKSILISYFFSFIQNQSSRMRGPIGYCEITSQTGIFICSFQGRFSCWKSYPYILFSLALITFPLILVKIPSVQLVIWMRIDILLGEQKLVMTPTSIPFALQSSSFSLKQDRLNRTLNSLLSLQQYGQPSIPSPSQSNIFILLAAFLETSKGLSGSKSSIGGAELTIYLDRSAFSNFSLKSSFYFLRVSLHLDVNQSSYLSCSVSMFF